MTDEPANVTGGRQTNANTYHHRNRQVTIPDGAMAVGLIVGAHGLRGELKIELHTDYEQRFAVGNSILLGEKLIEVKILTSRPHKAFQLIRIAGVDSRSDAEGMRGQWLFIPDDEAISLENDEYWIHDIVGITVVDTQGRVLGTVRNILETGANDVYIIDANEELKIGREILLPAISEVVQEIDTDNRTLTVELIPGLLEDLDSDG